MKRNVNYSEYHNKIITLHEFIGRISGILLWHQVHQISWVHTDEDRQQVAFDRTVLRRP